MAGKFKFNVGVDFIKIEFLDKKIEILHQCARVDRKDVVDKSRSFLIKVNCSRMNEKFKVEEKKNNLVILKPYIFSAYYEIFRSGGGIFDFSE